LKPLSKNQLQQPATSPASYGSALFVGGANDGKRMDLHDLPIVRLPLPPDQQTSWRGIETEDYRKERLATKNRVFEFYVSVGLSTESAIARLLACYTPNDKSSDREQ
jgi:hypothetical protein